MLVALKAAKELVDLPVTAERPAPRALPALEGLPEPGEQQVAEAALECWAPSDSEALTDLEVSQEPEARWVPQEQWEPQAPTQTS